MSLEFLANFLTISVVLIEIICCILLFDTFLIRKQLIKNYFLEYIIKLIILIIFCYLITRNVRNSILQGTLIILLYFIIIEIFYDAKKIIKLCISIITFMLLMTVDIFSSILIYYFLSLPINSIRNDPLYFFLAAVLSKTLLYMIIVIIRKVLNFKRFPELKYISKYHWFVYILQSTISMCSLMALIETTYQLGYIPLLAILSSFGLLCLNYAVLFLLESSANHGKTEHENALYRQQIETETNNIKVLIRSFETQTQYFHDYKQNLSTIHQLIEDKNYQQAREIIREIQDDIYVSLYRLKTNHDVIDAILNQKYLHAENSNVILDIRAGDLRNISIPNYLLVTIISNAIDNAIEACELVSLNRIVTVKLIEENGFLVFSVVNPIKAPVLIYNNLIKTTKKDNFIHGVGLKNISIALSKCNGSYEIMCSDHTFQFTALIKL